MKLRWHLRSSVNERVCYKSCAVTYHSLATGKIDFRPEDETEVPQSWAFFTRFEVPLILKKCNLF